MSAFKSCSAHLIFLSLALFCCGNFGQVAVVVAQDSVEKMVADQEKALDNSVLDFPKLKFENQHYKFDQTKQGDPVKHQFWFGNEGKGDLVLISLKSTCGCTVATASTGPYKSGQRGFIELTYDTRGKFGYALKEVTVVSNDPKSPHVISIAGNVVMGQDHPVVKPGDVLFVGVCAQCHAVPAKGKSGKELYDGVCHLCHDLPQETGKKWVAPNKSELSNKSRRKLRKMISDGLPYSSMPGFALKNGGPLTDAQIDSLIDYLHSLGKD